MIAKNAGFLLLSCAAAYNVLLLRECHAASGFAFTLGVLVIYMFSITKLDDFHFVGGDSNLVRSPFSAREEIHVACYLCLLLILCLGKNISIKNL